MVIRQRVADVYRASALRGEVIGPVEQAEIRYGGEAAGQGVVVDGRGGGNALGEDDVPEADVLLRGPCGADTDEPFAAVLPAELSGVYEHGGRAHAGGHDGYALALVRARVAPGVADLIHADSAFQVLFRDISGAQRVARQDDVLGDLPGSRAYVHAHLHIPLAKIYNSGSL